MILVIWSRDTIDVIKCYENRSVAASDVSLWPLFLSLSFFSLFFLSLSTFIPLCPSNGLAVKDHHIDIQVTSFSLSYFDFQTKYKWQIWAKSYRM